MFQQPIQLQLCLKLCTNCSDYIKAEQRERVHESQVKFVNLRLACGLVCQQKCSSINNTRLRGDMNGFDKQVHIQHAV